MTPRSCALGCGLWLTVMALPAVAFLLATQGELAWRRGPGQVEVDRLFLINEPEAGGLGYELARITSDGRAAEARLCVRTRVRYWLWRSQEATDPNVDYCQCYLQAPSGELLLNGDCR